MRSLRLAALVLIGSLNAASTPAWADDPAADQAALIEGLGHPIYAERRDARRRLRTLGLSAFDALRAANRHEDPEISEASRQLLGEVIESWVWPDDPPSARRLLEGYSDGYLDGRLECVVGLTKLPLERGVAPLVRIARFDASDTVARSAAAALLDSGRYQLSPVHEKALSDAVEDLNARYGKGKRLAAEWLDLAAREGASNPSITAWREQAARLDQVSQRHEEGAAAWVREQILWRWLRAALRHDDAEASADTVAALMEIEPEEAGQRLSRALEWACDADASESARRLESEHAESLRDKRGLYRRAELASHFGEEEEAERLAAEALSAAAQIGGGKAADEARAGPAVLIAAELRRRGRSDWALAEYEAAAGVFAPDKPIVGIDAMVAWRLADIHYDAARYAEASAALAPLIAVCDASQAARERYDNLPQVKYGFLPRRGGLRSHSLLCGALAAREAGDRATEQAELLRAIRSDSDNADIAIAMHRVQEPTEEFARKTREVIVEMRRIFEQRIWEWEESDEPNEKPEYQASLYNQWAWLVSNTTGDYDKAVRYSQRALRHDRLIGKDAERAVNYSLQSLKLVPDTAGYLDTLGRCLFSAGRVEEAIQTQRRAVELQPWVEVMRRQLSEFEAAQQPIEAP